MEQSNLALLFTNIFLVLFIAGTSSLYQLQLDLIDIETTLNNYVAKIPLVPEMLTLIISSFVIGKFVLSYLSLAAHIIAFYPILNYDLYDLLIPTIIIQSFHNVLFNIAELVFGSFTCKYYLTKATTACNLFYFKMVSKTVLGMVVLNLYWNFYTCLRYPVIKIIPTREFLKQIPNSANHSNDL